MISMAFSRTSISVAALTGLLALLLWGTQRTTSRGNVRNSGLFGGRHHRRGRTVWLAGQTATVDDAGKSLAGDLDGQVRRFSRISTARSKRRAASSSDMVQMNRIH